MTRRTPFNAWLDVDEGTFYTSEEGNISVVVEQDPDGEYKPNVPARRILHKTEH